MVLKLTVNSLTTVGLGQVRVIGENLSVLDCGFLRCG